MQAIMRRIGHPLRTSGEHQLAECVPTQVKFEDGAPTLMESPPPASQLQQLPC